MYLEEISYIGMGVVLKRKQIEYGMAHNYEYKLFNLKSYEENIPFELFCSNESLENFVVQKGDLLFRMAYPIKIIPADEKIDGCLINNQYCIIKVDKNLYNPNLLKWFLESAQASVQFEKVAIGTMVKSVPINALRKLQIPKLSQSKQEKLAKVADLYNEEKKLTTMLALEKEKYYNYVMKKNFEMED